MIENTLKQILEEIFKNKRSLIVTLLVHNGFVKGWMEIVGFSEQPFVCTTTNRKWDGKFIQRSGPFHYLQEKIPYKGFQGFRYFDLNEYKLENNIE